jgi:hypothetical protein
MAEAVFGGALAQAVASADTRLRQIRASETRTGNRIDAILTGYGMRKADGTRRHE